jgi:hypothetical protein
VEKLYTAEIIVVFPVQPFSSFGARKLPRLWAKIAFFEGVIGWTNLLGSYTEMML